MDTDKYKELLVRLVEIPSVTHREDAACEYLTETAGRFGWDGAHRDEAGSVIASRGTGEKEIILMGHIDTVPGGPPCRVDGDILWGRGAVDAKGPLAAFVTGGGAAEIPYGWKLTLIAAVGEEGDSRGALHALPRYKPAACVIGEPSGTDGITIGYRGYIRVKVSAHDEGAHRSGDSGPLTACLLAASDMLGEAERRDDRSKPVIERTSGAVISMLGKDEGGRSAAVDLDIRLPLGTDMDELEWKLRKIGQLHGVGTELVSSMPAHIVEKSDPLVRALRVAVREAGLTPRLLAKGGTADFNIAAAWNCPMAAYGPGDSRLDHTSAERIDLNGYLQAARILKGALEGFMET